MKNRGFTLVELLAVIVILSILLIITLPGIMSLFNEAKKNSFITETKKIFDLSHQQWVNDSMFDTQEEVYARAKNEQCGKSLNLSGREEIYYYIKIDKAGNVVEYYTEDGTYQYFYQGTGLKIEDIEGVAQISKINENDVITIMCNGVSVDSSSGSSGDNGSSNEEETIIDVNIDDVIGEYVNYDCITGVDDDMLSYKSAANSNGYNEQTFTVDKITPIKWKIFGTETVNDKTHILIIAADPIFYTNSENTINYYKLTLKGTLGYISGPGEMNKICGLYGQGQYADTSRYTYYLNGKSINTGARNLKVEDINEIQSYTPPTPSMHIYTKNNDGYIYYGSGSGTKTNYKKYMGYNDGYDTTRSIGVFTLATGKSVTVPSTKYSYTLKTNTEIQKLVAYNDDGTKSSYWLASPAIYCVTNSSMGLNTHFEMRYVFSGSMSSGTVFYSTGTGETFGNRGIRPIVSLDSDVYLSKKENNVWILKSK